MTPTIGSRWRLTPSGLVYEVRAIALDSVVLVPAFDARRSSVHMTARALVTQGTAVAASYAPGAR